MAVLVRRACAAPVLRRSRTKQLSATTASEINAPPVLFPIPVARRIEAIAFRRGTFTLGSGVGCGVVGVFGFRIVGVGIVFNHLDMPISQNNARIVALIARTHTTADVSFDDHSRPTMPTFPVVAHIHCIAIEGADARRFAQTQFSGDVDALAPGHWQWNAWLNAQGRVQALMQLVDAGNESLFAMLRGGDAQAIHAALARYLLRAKAKLTIRALTARAGGPLPSGTVQRDADSMVLGYGPRSLRLAPVDADAVVDPPANTGWRLADIRAGWPTLAAEAQPKFLPPALGLEHLGAIAFDKGCYPGQEIAARLHYRGGHKHRLCHLGGASPLPLGDIRSATGAVQASILDTVRSADGYDSLAVLAFDTDNKISILDNIYIINKKFDP